jgi:uncharacterized membrane protein
MNPIIIFWFTILLLSEAFALYFVKKSSDSKNYSYLALSILLYGCIPLFLYFILIKTHKIGRLNFTWNIASNIYGFMIGILIFSEVYHMRQAVGVILGIAGVILMNA